MSGLIKIDFYFVTKIMVNIVPATTALSNDNKNHTDVIFILMDSLSQAVPHCKLTVTLYWDNKGLIAWEPVICLGKWVAVK